MCLKILINITSEEIESLYRNNSSYPQSAIWISVAMNMVIIAILKEIAHNYQDHNLWTKFMAEDGRGGDEVKIQETDVNAIEIRTAAKRRELMLERELNRIRLSISFRLGLHLTKAIRHPWRLLFLPFSILYLMFIFGLEMLGLRPSPVSGSIIEQDSAPRNCIVFFPTNGVGFGHFTRLFAVAQRFRKKDPNCEIIFFTTMPTLHLLYAEGFPTYHLAGAKKFQGMGSGPWNTVLEEMLTLVIDTHRPQTFVFDGAFPYRGMLNTIRNHSTINKVWVRRGSFRSGVNIPVDSIEKFDLIVHPEDAVPLQPSEIEHEVEVLSVAPITLIDEDEMWTKESARRRLGIPLDSIVVYVQLGAGQINEIDSDVRIIVNALLKYEKVNIILGESMLGDRFNIDLERVHLLRDYPNTLFAKAFDASVQAGGYNSFHEMRRLGLPTLFIPNLNTGMDDQKARCEVSEIEGWGSVLSKVSKTSVEAAIVNLMSKIDGENQPIILENGAVTLVNHLLLNR
jgi:UDP-N-acetylglucosamine--N-acetylmuramyl-(pentapeptide) pyrophosphoryl-undecaprenol N-acetylglucosamine transferase